MSTPTTEKLTTLSRFWDALPQAAGFRYYWGQESSSIQSTLRRAEELRTMARALEADAAHETAELEARIKLAAQRDWTETQINEALLLADYR